MPPPDEPPAQGAPLPDTSPEARALYAEASTLSAARKHGKAIEAYRACLKADPDLAVARLGLCASLWAAGEREAAKAEAGPLEALVPRDEQTWRRAFILLRKLDDHTSAEIVTRRFISEAGGSAEARIELVAMQPVLHRRPRDRIEADLADVLRRPGEEPLFWRRVAEQQRRLGRLDDALDATEHALRIKPDDFEARCQRVEILIRQDKEPLARKHLAEAVPFMPDTMQGFLQMGEIATEAHDAAIAHQAIDRALGMIKPDSHGPRLRLIRVMLAQGDDRAMEMIRYLTAVCEDAKTLRHLFELCYDRDYKELALAAGEKFERIAPVDYEIATRLDSLRFIAATQEAAAAGVGRSAPGRRRGLAAWLLGGGKKV